MREGEILNLREKQVHFFNSGSDEGYLELYDGETKNGEGRKVPFGAEVGSLLRDHLDRKKKGGPEKFLFTTEKGNLLGNFRRAFQRACKRASIEGLCFHDFRHTAINNWRKAGHDYFKIMAASGHRTVSVFKRYNMVDEGELKTLVNPDSIVKKWSNSPDNPTEDHSLKQANLLK